MTSYSDKQDFIGRKKRQRKPRDIVMDTREPDNITELLLNGGGYTVERRALKVGDYAWDLKPASYLTTRLAYRYIVVERKTLADLRDVPRLMDQVRRMQVIIHSEPAGSQTLFIILLEYRFDRDRKRKWSDYAIRNAKLSLQLAGVKIAECEDNGIADAIDKLYQWSNKNKHELIGGD
ncbi:hypothetical protein LCGC14_1168690 [marine sediment metagenome]|uniref:ERCC4 domain-containing protein n=1 Tax=marine sediment metagenome TaxID=412755 RepID=A0A0F9LQM7_9ZZZZ